MDETSNIEQHAEIGPADRWARQQAHSLFGAMLAGSCGALAFGFVAEILAAGYGAALGTVGFVIGIALHALWLKRRKNRADKTLVGLNRKIHDLEQTEFELRYQKALKRGDLDRWKRNDG